MKNFSFAALDFETACFRNNICEIGIATVDEGEISGKYNWLVRPEGNKYVDSNVALHGITPEMTKNAPTLKDVWPEVFNILEKYNIVVMHNAPFDRHLILNELKDIGEHFPSCEYFCTYYISLYARKYGCKRAELGILCNHFGISIKNQHRAGDDAEAAARLFLAELQEAKATTFEELEERLGFKRGRFMANYDYDSQERICKKIKAKDIKGDPGLFIPESPFYGKRVCFTGTMRDGNRTYCLQQIADIGGIPLDNVTMTTDYLVVGSLDRKKTTKQKQAEKYISQGYPIQVISDDEYYHIIDTYNL